MEDFRPEGSESGDDPLVAALSADPEIAEPGDDESGKDPDAGGGNEPEPGVKPEDQKPHEETVPYARFKQFNETLNLVTATLQDPETRAAFRRGYIKQHGYDPFPDEAPLPTPRTNPRDAVEDDDPGFDPDSEAGILYRKLEKMEERLNKVVGIATTIETTNQNEAAQKMFNTCVAEVEEKYGVKITSEQQEAIKAELNYYKPTPGVAPVEIVDRAFRSVRFAEAYQNGLKKGAKVTATKGGIVKPGVPGGKAAPRTDYTDLRAALSDSFRENE